MTETRWGGSLLSMGLERRLTISYVTNQMQPGIIGSDVVAACSDASYSADRVVATS